MARGLRNDVARVCASINFGAGHNRAGLSVKVRGLRKFFQDKASGGRWDRPELHRLLDQLRKGDVLVVWRLDRLSRSLRDVLMIMERIQEALQSIGEVRLLEKSLTPTRRIR